MNAYILGLREINKNMLALAGGKGANLGELFRIEGLKVPDGFCISAEAFNRVIRESPRVNDLLRRLSILKAEERDSVRELSTEIRNIIEQTAIPADISEEIIRHLAGPRENNAFAVRSSATEEDLPAASFAGQQDTYLNIIGKDQILKHISKCWASLFTGRAVIYRLQNGIDHRKVSMSVIVQEMVFPQAAGIMFTADPLTANRKVVSIDAGWGLGEAMVSGLVNTDNYKVRNGGVTDKMIPAKQLGIYAVQDGGTNKKAIDAGMQQAQVLTDKQIVELERIGRKIEEHFNHPQDIEWCLADDRFYIVQSRPITTLYPVPEANDEENRVYVSVGHQQMMTDPIKPLGLSVWLLTTRAPMRTAGGRLFVDLTQQLSTTAGRKALLNTLGKSDPLTKDTLMTIMEREDFIKQLPDDKKAPEPGISNQAPSTVKFQASIEDDPAIVSDLMDRNFTSIEKLKQAIPTKSGTELFDFILEDIQQLKNVLFDPKNFEVIMTIVHASSWINEKMYEWLGEKNAADILSRSVPNNITSEMGMALLDVADVIRPYPSIVDFLQHVKENDFLDKLDRFKGGPGARDAISAFLNIYGMRCSGEIDITRTRWSEKPLTLIPLILSNVKNFEAGAGSRKFEQGQQESIKKERELLERLAALPDGELKAGETKKVISMIRHFTGYREFPKYSIVSRYFIYKQALLREAEKLVRDGVLQEKEDVYFLRFEEFRDAVRTHNPDNQLINRRKEEYKIFEKLDPPRMITSDGEIITGRHKRENLPAGALAGLAVSSGVIEGRARVILNMEEADIGEEDILVTSFTDPSWTPLFVSVKGLVTEVGGIMTHGAVIAREYGLPAVVCVEHATSLIKDGQRIRVNGTEGYVELL